MSSRAWAEPFRLGTASVHFMSGARIAWQTRAPEHTIYVTEGTTVSS